MKAGLIAVLAVLAGIALLCFMSFVSAYNYGNTTETALFAQYENNKNIHANYTLKIGEMAQIPKMQMNHMSKLVKTAMESRYGEEGSGAVMQWIQEQNPNLDPALYQQIQQEMVAGRNEFTVAQTSLLDRKRAYETEISSLWRGFWLGVAGYPKRDLREIKVVVASTTQDTFRAGVDQGVKLDTE